MPGPEPGLLAHHPPVPDYLGVLGQPVEEVRGARLTHAEYVEVRQTAEAVVGAILGKLVPARVLEVWKEPPFLLKKSSSKWLQFYEKKSRINL